jgi:phage gpG-like protein
MRNLGDLAGAATFFGAIARDFHGHAKELEAAAVALETEAKSLPGEYQTGWPALQPATIARKATGDSPLLETGELRDSIVHNSDEHEAHVGSNNPKMRWHEFGTKRMPPRPILGVAVVQAEAAIVAAVGNVVMQRIAKPWP